MMCGNGCDSGYGYDHMTWTLDFQGGVGGCTGQSWQWRGQRSSDDCVLSIYLVWWYNRDHVIWTFPIVAWVYWVHIKRIKDSVHLFISHRVCNYHITKSILIHICKRIRNFQISLKYMGRHFFNLHICFDIFQVVWEEKSVITVTNYAGCFPGEISTR